MTIRELRIIERYKLSKALSVADLKAFCREPTIRKQYQLALKYGIVLECATCKMPIDGIRYTRQGHSESFCSEGCSESAFFEDGLNEKVSMGRRQNGEAAQNPSTS